MSCQIPSRVPGTPTIKGINRAFSVKPSDIKLIDKKINSITNAVATRPLSSALVVIVTQPFGIGLFRKLPINVERDGQANQAEHD